MTLFRFLSVTTYRHYLESFIDSIVPLNIRSAITLTADFRNPQTINEASFRNPQTVNDVDFITIQET